jgi:hypothetical protein
VSERSGDCVSMRSSVEHRDVGVVEMYVGCEFTFECAINNCSTCEVRCRLLHASLGCVCWKRHGESLKGSSQRCAENRGSGERIEVVVLEGLLEKVQSKYSKMCDTQ